MQDDVERLTGELDVLTTEFVRRKHAMELWREQVAAAQSEENSVFAQPPPTNDSEAAADWARSAYLRAIIADFLDRPSIWLDW